MTIHVSLKRTNLNLFNISAPNCCIWQHIGGNCSATHIQKLTNVLVIPLTQLHRHLIDLSKPILQFEINRNSEEEGPSLTGEFLTHLETYMGFLGIFIASIGVYFLKKFLCRPASPRCQPYTPVSLCHATVDDDVEATPIYRSGGKV